MHVNVRTLQNFLHSTPIFFTYTRFPVIHLGDPLLRELKTTVVSCIVHQPPTHAGKKTKKAPTASTIPGDFIVEVILQDTIIFPEGGGQPTDTGIITTSDGTSWEVVRCERHGGHAVHFVRVPGDTAKAIEVFAAEAPATVVLDQADYERRYDHVGTYPLYTPLVRWD